MTDEQDERKRRAIAVAVELVHLLEDQDAGGRRRVARPAQRHDVDVVERLERADDGIDQQEEGGGRKQRNGDTPEELPAVGAVNPGRLVQLGGDVAQPGQEDGRVVAHEHPGRVDDDGDQRQAGRRPTPAGTVKPRDWPIT